MVAFDEYLGVRALDSTLRREAPWLVGWGVVTLFFTTQLLVWPMPGSDRTWPVGLALEVNAIFFGLWALASFLIRKGLRRFPVGSPPRAGWVAAWIVAGLAFAVAQLLAAAVAFELRSWLHGAQAALFSDLEGQIGFVFAANFHWNVMIACALIVFESALDSERRARREALRAVELSQALTSAELAALRMQIQPHFLFNALNSISALMSSDAARADAMLVRFAELLRATLLSSRKATTTLAEELRFSARYLDLERLRFGDRLAVVFDLPAELAGLEVPNLLLQPLVENAVKHGVQRRVGPVRLALSVRRRGDDVEVELCNDRETEKDGIGAAGLGVGLENVRRRLALAFGSGAALELDLSDPRVARTRVRFPARAGAVEAGGGAGLVTIPRGDSK